MGCLIDLTFAIVSLLVIVTYAGLTLIGATPEKALLIAIGGGIVVGSLLSVAFRILSNAEEGVPTQTHEDVASPVAPSGDYHIKRSAK